MMSSDRVIGITADTKLKTGKTDGAANLRIRAVNKYGTPDK